MLEWPGSSGGLVWPGSSGRASEPPHAATLQAIWKERGRFKVSKAPRSPEAVVTDVKRRLQGLANARYAWVQRWEEWHGHEKKKEAGEHSMEMFESRWIDSDIAKIVDGQKVPVRIRW